ncbi:heavy metal translocating P-type ATPase [Roseinatronobacter alkalisoli]|uniref:P-type Zn(2+) transporter n=1 Tax=Roseinatronobacter alkalisoli TaxID=3028235 RepID=A0ABT5TDS0_9RHOB|nr:heavy metal translocating P-type ATPase [Roseinatronobacter sp. HJB301]MDD7973272.1 heavy metal translocating P-type ATPase [Roseinatronobacter sp. HJB301]
MTDQLTERREWTVTGMDCAACTTKVVRAVERLPGVSEVKVALMAQRLSLNLTADMTAPEVIEGIVRKLGFGIVAKGASAPRKQAFVLPDANSAAVAEPVNDSSQSKSDGVLNDRPHAHVYNDPAGHDGAWYHTAKGRLVILTGTLLAIAWLIELLTSAEAGYWAFVAACLIGVAPVAKRAFEALRIGQPFTIEGLMTIAAGGALVIGAAEEAALVVFLFAVGEVLEGVAAGKARQGIQALADLVPKTALLEVDGTTRIVPAENLQIGQIVLVRPGDRIPADGDIIDGTSGVDESPVTGESMPRSRSPGDAVFAGAINTEAVLHIRVTKEPSDNTIARIIRLVEEAEEARAPTERFIDRFSRVYMPAIVALAVLVAVIPPLAFDQDWNTWIYRALALLLIGCPCALVISVPAAIASALSAGARRGLLMKGGAVIEAAAKTTHVAFDKTGTLTRGNPTVTDITPADGVSEGDLLAVAAGVESGSSHPLARAILRKAKENSTVAAPSRDARVLPGKGAEAIVGEERAWVCSPTYAAEIGGIDAAATSRAIALEEEGATVVAVFRAGQPLGLIAMRDEPRADAAEAVRQLKALGIASTMLTGDNIRTAKAIAGRLDLGFQAGMMPEDKLAAIRKLGATAKVMMIGDGINDAPALKEASTGVAMGSGTDVALETADAAILRDRVTDAPAMIRLARATIGNIRQNLTLALGLKAVFLVTTVLGITGLWIAILADTGATVLVTLNALRLLAFNPTKEA